LRYESARDADAPLYHALLGGETVGEIELDEKRGAESGEGWVTRCEMDGKWRGYGLGVQLIGQAVSYYRARGRDKICVSAKAGDDMGFFIYNGFERAEQSGGGAALVKNIAMR
jgi:probable phosphoglycerate mutase